MIPKLIEQRLPALRGLCAQYRVQRLELFGSHASGGEVDASSDIDFLVEFEPSTPEQHTDRYFGLLFDLESLFAPRRIDLVERQGVRNRYVLQSIERSRVSVYAAA